MRSANIIVHIFLLFSFLSACSQKEIKNVSYKNDIVPIIEEHCSDCHYGNNIEGNIRLDSYQSLINSRYFNKDIPMIVAGNPAESRIYVVVSSNRELVRMPPVEQGYDKLTENELNIIKNWIQEGAKDN